MILLSSKIDCNYYMRATQRRGGYLRKNASQRVSQCLRDVVRIRSGRPWLSFFFNSTLTFTALNPVASRLSFPLRPIAVVGQEYMLFSSTEAIVVSFMCSSSI